MLGFWESFRFCDNQERFWCPHTAHKAEAERQLAEQTATVEELEAKHSAELKAAEAGSNDEDEIWLCGGSFQL